jgi:hypothetical protein
MTKVLPWAVLAFLVWTAWKGAQRTPEIASRIDPGRFYGALAEDSAGAAIMKERHVDFIDETLRALAMRRAEVAARPDSLVPGSLVTSESLELAQRRETARWYRESINFGQARYNLARQQALAESKRPEPLSCEPARERAVLKGKP